MLSAHAQPTERVQPRAAELPRPARAAPPGGDVARVRANVAALAALRELESGGRVPSVEEQDTLARWSGWGAAPAVFDPKAAHYERFAAERDQLRELLSAEEFEAARRNTLNAHYTDPAYVEAIWQAVRELGFTDGTVLEPGCGSGNFLVHTSDRDQAVGVELEPVTAAIAAMLHPRAAIRNESFADTLLPEQTFDLVIGNVPFGDVTLHDRRHNQAGHRIHNHFIMKSLHLTRPGGLMAVITSRYTLDAANPSARREIAELADLVGAVRLPTGAHRRTAGTDVVTDVLILRRRAEGLGRAGFGFERSIPTPVPGAEEALRINQYFLAHPAHVLGRLRADQGDRGRTELGVDGPRAAGPALGQALAGIVARAREQGLGLTERTAPAQAAPAALLPVGRSLPDGYLAITAEVFTRQEDGAPAPYTPAATQAKELRALLGLRDRAVALLEAEASSIDDTAAIVSLREELGQRYDQYVATYGPINRFNVRPTGRVDPGTGEPLLARIRPGQGGFRADPYANVVYALEHFDAAAQSATKATIFRERVVCRRVPRLGADTPEDALAICLDNVGEVRLHEVARLLGVEEHEARRQLGTLVFDEPRSERLVPAAEYLSGNVRSKLAAAERAAEREGRFAPNVEALTAVLPRDLSPAEIHARLGAAWIDAAHVEHFLRETLEDPSVRVEHPGGALWTVRSTQRKSVLATTKWGTERCSAVDLAQALLEQRQIRIYDENADGERVFNATETLAAAEKAKELGEHFAEWVWQDPERASALARTYNDRFNAIVPRSYDGAQLSLPGLALAFRPRAHQIAAVARVISEPAVGLFHEVGAGKTAEMVMSAMELRRLGLVHKPVVVVPNHMLEQFSREWLQLYPQAKILAACNEDLDRERRRLFVAKCATGDWDAIVMTRSAFERIPMSLEAQKEYLRSELDAVVAMIERAKADDASFSLKRLERMRLQAEERIKSKLDGAKDPGLTFEQLGIDYLFVDEAHAYKNLRTMSNIPGMAVDGSQRASDLHMKLEYLRAKHARVATLATATPIANSMGEAYTMQRYLRPDLLHEAGITDFDQWAGTFGETATAIEVAPDGTGMRMQTRFSKFRNVPELLLQWRVSADIKTAEDLKLPVPPLAARASDGQRAPETVVVAPSEELRHFVSELAHRAERVRSRCVSPSEDNLLRISSDGRAAGLDLRLLELSTDEPQKADVAAKRIAAIYHEHCGQVFEGADGSPHRRAGALQLVFSDLGTPKGGDWSVYEHLRGELVAQGVPRVAVRFVHEAKNDREKAELFAACRDGRVAVLVGSTERMGVGTNVQLRAVALHHLDCPWRPADIAQREGRILRQGNANAEVQILRYVTEGSFDAYLWQTVTRKAQFISQVMRGRLDVREIDDLGDAALSYNEVKALATGNPMLLEHAEAQAEVQRLERLQRSHGHAQQTLRTAIRDHGERLTWLDQRVASAEVAMARVAAAGDALRITVGSRTYSKRTDANEALRDALIAQLKERGGRDDTPVRLGTVLDNPLVATTGLRGQVVTVTLQGVPGCDLELRVDDVARASLVSRLENRLRELPQVRDAAQRQRLRLTVELERARAELGAPFRQLDQLQTARERLHSLDEQLAAAVAPPVPERPGTEGGTRDDEDPPRAPSDSSAAQVATHAEDLAAQWNDLVTREQAAVDAAAVRLERRLNTRVAALSARLAAHQGAQPAAPGALNVFSSASADHETALESWRSEGVAVERALGQQMRRLEALRGHRAESCAGSPARASSLAIQRVARRHPELAEHLATLRALQRRGAIADTLERERGREGEREL